MKANKRYIFGTWQDTTTPLDVSAAEEICRNASRAVTDLQTYPQDKVLRTLARVQEIWANPNSRYRKEAALELPKITGFSPAMIDMALKELAATLDPSMLLRKFKHENNGVPLSPQYHFSVSSRTILSAFPIGTVFHVLSGNVFLVGVGSWLEGIITGNVNILKMSSNETYFMPLFLESLNEVDDDGVLSKSVAAIDVRSSSLDVIEVFKQNVDGLVIWGGEDAVRTYRNGLPARTRVVVFGPKVSFAIVTEQGFKSQSTAAVAKKLAQEIAIWDQNACTAPQVCFVQGEENTSALLEAMGPAMREICTELPSGTPPPDTAAEIRKIRGVREVSEARGDGKLLESGHHNVDWTVYVDKMQSMDLSPLHRTLRLTPFTSLVEIANLIAPMRGYLQTVGAVATPTELQEIFHSLSRFGVQRVFEVGTMFSGEIDDPHDGAYDLPQLMNISVSRLSEAVDASGDPWDHHPKRQEIIDARLRNTFDTALKTPFYAKSMGKFKVNCAKDLEQLPLLDRSEWTKHMVPESKNLCAQAMEGGYITQSGGSTGTPKYSYFSKSEWDTMVSYAGRVFRAMGFTSHDRVGNFMSSADLYGGFVSFNAVTFGLGAQCYSLGPHPSEEILLDAFKKFRLNALIGFPPTLVAILRQAKAKYPALTIERILFSGSRLSPTDREWLATELKCRNIVSVIGTTEANHIAYQCLQQSGTSLHHTCDDYNYLELVDSSGKRVSGEEYGRILVTSLHKTTIPVVRYVIGDKARWVEGVCACGRLDRVIDYQGRWDTIVCVANMNIDMQDVKRVLTKFPITEFQLIVTNKNGREAIELLCESPQSLDDESIFNALSALRGFETQSGLLDVNVRCVRVGEITRQPRTGKVSEIIDERT